MICPPGELEVSDPAGIAASAASGDGPAREVRLTDGTHASAGDLVVTRHNDRSLRTRSGTWVKNGDRWDVRSVGSDGALLVAPANRRAGGHESVTLPIGYVEQHVLLGYAGTIHGAQGATVDTTHTVLAGTESRQSLYVALSRGRHENHLYLGDDTTAVEGVAFAAQHGDNGPREILTGILDRDECSESATRAGTADPYHELTRLIQQYEDALPLLAQHVIGTERMRLLDDALERWMPGLTSQPAYPGLRGQVAIRWAEGESLDEVLQQASWWQTKDELAGEEDPATALARIVARAGPYSSTAGAVPPMRAAPALLGGEPEIDQYLQRLTTRIAALGPDDAFMGRADSAVDQCHRSQEERNRLRAGWDRRLHSQRPSTWGR